MPTVPPTGLPTEGDLVGCRGHSMELYRYGIDRVPVGDWVASKAVANRSEGRGVITYRNLPTAPFRHVRNRLNLEPFRKGFDRGSNGILWNVFGTLSGRGLQQPKLAFNLPSNVTKFCIPRKGFGTIPKRTMKRSSEWSSWKRGR
jgi:hypothetical protein